MTALTITLNIALIFLVVSFTIVGIYLIFTLAQIRKVVRDISKVSEVISNPLTLLFGLAKGLKGIKESFFDREDED